MAEIVIYASKFCPYCYRAKSLLKKKGAAYREIDVHFTKGARAEMMERSGRHTVPQIFIDGKPIGGSDDLAALDRAGELDLLLGT